MQLEYRSNRRGFASMVTGLLHGLGMRFRTPVALEEEMGLPGPGVVCEGDVRADT